ncbi:MAG: anti-anti-sigma factor [Chlamydiae bacterium GWC2_50_10]|nr:MAG: anti-anti-sigma factor [Chlamydiae bacterium GWA2_50_15]OGN54727.1 MAG: anti-anti-sigma factor [Chlamydiae bacterium GWF2_49_8]OGN54899.1 MAG: anti-anti-sigma factor [Chlamydiae bacterium GWC2_50_10]OGN58566.1 MAG: anti-anti-sigma factor [Chlamydiae bacterium RIFCSPHIGHO2_02_FULL_49_29]OGN62771.1 MAG: anti-anti-sigma factor [Chlamydiae bacterium RIFCSPHIGHO2_12_FULL_49_32]OGN70298.1 MAG: anti-anti-sigma factor [Chlamydiae bacterium RIFCSPLOWO2_02_FULL_49_12]OGN71496.1 MAG: anti-anti-s
MTLNVKVEEKAEKTILHLEGRLDAISAPTLDQKLMDLMRQKRKKILLDFSQVDYLSSAGMRLLLSFTKQLKHQEGRLTSYAMNEEVLEIIRMAGFDRILNIFSNEEDAFKSSSD